MRKALEVLLELPGEREIESINEVAESSESGFIVRTIRYRNGLTVVLRQDVHHLVYRIELHADTIPLWIKGKQLIIAN